MRCYLNLDSKVWHDTDLDTTKKGGSAVWKKFGGSRLSMWRYDRGRCTIDVMGQCVKGWGLALGAVGDGEYEQFGDEGKERDENNLVRGQRRNFIWVGNTINKVGSDNSKPLIQPIIVEVVTSCTTKLHPPLFTCFFFFTFWIGHSKSQKEVHSVM